MTCYFIYDGEKYQFDGFDGDLETYDIDNGTLFFTKTDKYLLQFLELEDGVIVDGYHIKFMDSVISELKRQFNRGVTDIIIDVDTLLNHEDRYGKDFDVWFTASKHRVRNDFSTYYNMGVLYDFSFIPVDSLKTDDKYSIFMYGDKEALVVGTDIERFPAFVSHNILCREIDKVMNKHVLDFKMIDLEKVLMKGLHVRSLLVI